MAPPEHTSDICLILNLSTSKWRNKVWVNWPGWLTCSARFTYIGGHPSAAGRAQDRESSLAKTDVLPLPFYQKFRIFIRVFFTGNSLPTADRNQTDAVIGYLRFDNTSNSYKLVADSNTVREKYICKFSGTFSYWIILDYQRLWINSKQETATGGLRGRGLWPPN